MLSLTKFPGVRVFKLKILCGQRPGGGPSGNACKADPRRSFLVPYLSRSVKWLSCFLLFILAMRYSPPFRGWPKIRGGIFPLPPCGLQVMKLFDPNMKMLVWTCSFWQVLTFPHPAIGKQEKREKAPCHAFSPSVTIHLKGLHDINLA